MEAAHDRRPSAGQRAEEIDRPQRALGIQALGHRGGDRLPQPLVSRRERLPRPDVPPEHEVRVGNPGRGSKVERRRAESLAQSRLGVEAGGNPLAQALEPELGAVGGPLDDQHLERMAEDHG